MTVESPRVRSLLRQADRVAESGKRAAAEQLYRQIIDEAPETAKAWYGLAQVVADAQEKDAALERAVALDPAYVATAEEPEEPSDAPTALPETQTVTGRERSPAAAFSSDGRHEHELDMQSATTTEPKDERRDESIDLSPTSVAVQPEVVKRTETLFCANHPGRQTHLRCNRCGKPICSSCANPTPVGYRCPECIREQEDVYFTAGPVDYLLAALVALPLSIAAGWLATLLGFWSIFLAAFAGTLIGRVSFRVARRKRGRWLPHLVTACVVIGGVLPAVPLLLGMLYGQFSLQLLFTGIYIVMASGATYYQMR